MKGFLLIIALTISVSCLAQNIPKKANTILVHGATLKEVGERLLDSGFILKTVDTSFKTIETEYKKFCSDCIPSSMLFIRIKDSVAYITGKWESSGNILQIGMGSDKETQYTFIIQNESGPVPKKMFAMMKNFAASFNKPIEYAVK